MIKTSRLTPARIPFALGCLATLLCVMPSSGFAQQTTQDLVAEATQKFQASDFEGAAGAFMKAFELSPDQPVLVKNAVVAWFSGDRCDKAVPLAKKYLDLQPSPTLKDGDESVRYQITKDRRDANTVVVKCRIRIAKAAYAKDDLATSKAALDGIELYSPEKDDAQELIRLRKQVTARQAELDLKNKGTTVTPVEGTSTKKMVGWGLVGLGGATLLAGGVYSIYVTSTYGGLPELTDEQASDPNQVQERRDAIKAVDDHNTRAWIIYPVGGALALTGAVLLYLDSESEDAAGASIYPLVGPDSAGVGATWRF